VTLNQFMTLYWCMVLVQTKKFYICILVIYLFIKPTFYICSLHASQALLLLHRGNFSTTFLLKLKVSKKKKNKEKKKVLLKASNYLFELFDIFIRNISGYIHIQVCTLCLKLSLPTAALFEQNISIIFKNADTYLFRRRIRDPWFRYINVKCYSSLY
jgi:hypothetical protein